VPNISIAEIEEKEIKNVKKEEQVYILADTIVSIFYCNKYLNIQNKIFYL